jgi:hypothetical protein
VRSRRPRAAALAGLFAGAALASSACSAKLDVTEASPAQLSARGGASLTVRGAGFAAGDVVHLGGELASALQLVSSTELHVTTPPLYAGPTTVTVTTAAGATASLPDGVDVLPLELRFVEAPPYALPVETDATVAGAALGDFDGDGDPDLITCAAGAPCQLLENDGRGNFTLAAAGKKGSRFPTGLPDTRALVAADLDGDGALDLVLGLGSGGPGAVYRNSGNATFTSAGAGALPADADPVTAVAVGDLDGDGRPDLVMANDTADSVPFRVYLNASKGSAIGFELAPEGTVPAADWKVSAIALVDADGDGRLDLVLATPGAADGFGCRLLLGTAEGFREAPERLPASAGDAIAAFATGDVNGDGAPDLVAVGAGQDRLFLNDGTGHFFDATAGSMPLDASTGTSVALVDLDRDRHLDLVIGNAGAETRLYLNDGSGRFFDHTPLLPIRADPTVWVGVADVDGDADQDLLIVNASPGPARLYLSVEPPAHDTP